MRSIMHHFWRSMNCLITSSLWEVLTSASEMGQIFRRLGSKVTVVHRSDRWPNARMRMSQIIAKFFQDEGVTLHLNAKIAGVGRSMRGVLMTLGMVPRSREVMSCLPRGVPRTPTKAEPCGGRAGDHSRGYVPTDAKLRKVPTSGRLAM